MGAPLDPSDLARARDVLVKRNKQAFVGVIGWTEKR